MPPTSPVQNRNGAILVLWICLAVISQNLLAFVAAKLLIWASKLTTLVNVSIVACVVIVAAYLTEYNALTLTQRVTAMFNPKSRLFIDNLFLVSSLLSAGLGVMLTLAFVFEDDSSYQIHSSGHRRLHAGLHRADNRIRCFLRGFRFRNCAPVGRATIVRSPSRHSPGLSKPHRRHRPRGLRSACLGARYARALRQYL